MAAVKRFAEASDTDIAQKRAKIQSENTIKCNKKAANTLRSYLKEKGQPERFEDFDQVALNEVLSQFYIEARRPDGMKYKMSSLENLRHSLNRYLNSLPNRTGKGMDIIKDPEFVEANINFKAAMAELKREGNGSITHYPIIADADIRKLYTSQYLMVNTPCGLMNKVQFDIRLYFFRRGGENMCKMPRNMFTVQTDPDTGRRYVSKALDELNKNHRDADKENSNAVMPELPDNPVCPVLSFMKYMDKLNPKCDRMWQKPRDSFIPEDSIWYCNSPVGEKTLASFMTVLSEKCKLSRKYTNHSIRATGATILSRSQYGAAQIMAVTGHKSVSSLAVYQRVGHSEKMLMGDTIAGHVTGDTQLALPPPKAQLALPGLGSSQVPTKGNTNTAIAIPAAQGTAACQDDVLKGISFEDLFSDFDDSLLATPQQCLQSVTTTQTNKLNNQMPMFNNCTFGNFTLNINYEP